MCVCVREGERRERWWGYTEVEGLVMKFLILWFAEWERVVLVWQLSLDTGHFHCLRERGGGEGQCVRVSE